VSVNNLGSYTISAMINLYGFVSVKGVVLSDKKRKCFQGKV